MTEMDGTKAVSELATATAAGREVTLKNGSKVQVRPLKFKQTVLTLQKLPPLLGMIEKMQAAGVEEVGLTDFLNVAPATAVEVACMCASGLTSAWFDEADTDEALDVMTAVWEVNKDFFVASVLPRFKRLGLDGTFAKLRQVGSNVSTS